MRRLLIAVLLISCARPAAATADDAIFHLALGDPARKDRELPVTLDTLVDSSTGARITPGELAARLQSTRLLLLGEEHTSVEFHRVQLQVLRALQASGRRVLVGLEMFPYTQQPSLDRWNSGELTDMAFVDQSQWYEHWGYPWNYYRDIFLFCRDARIPMYAVNAPREVVTAVRKKGFVNLTPDEAAHIPAHVNVDSPEHLAYFKAAISEGGATHPGMSDEALKGMLAAQATWDAAMGWNAVAALKTSIDPSAIMVVLVGNGHVAYGLGIERQARQFFDGGIATLVPVPVADSDGAPITSVRASYANFTYGVADERDAAYPSLGISTMPAQGGRTIIDVEKDTPGARAGLDGRRYHHRRRRSAACGQSDVQPADGWKAVGRCRRAEDRPRRRRADVAGPADARGRAADDRNEVESARPGAWSHAHAITHTQTIPPIGGRERRRDTRGPLARSRPDAHRVFDIGLPEMALENHPRDRPCQRLRGD